MTMVPNPRRCGADTGGPSRSVQLMVRASPLPQLMSTRPAPVDSAPYFPALVESEPDGLRGSRVQAKLRAVHGDTRANEIGEVRELGANQVRDLHPIPFVADEQVLIGGKRLDTFREPLDETFGISGGGLVSDRVDDAEHVLGAMIDFAHEEVLLFLALLALGDVLDGAAETHGPALTPGALEIGEPKSLHPADRAVCPPQPELGGRPLRIDRIERCLDGRPNHFGVVRMHPLHDLFDRGLMLGKIENFLTAGIS